MIDGIAQVSGIIAMVLIIVSYQQRTRFRILMFQIAANLFFIISYFLLKAYTGSAMSFLSLSRSVVFSVLLGRNKDNTVWLIVFILAFVIAGILTWSGIASLFAMIASLIVTVALHTNDKRRMRLLLLLCPVFYFVYNFINRSYGGMGTDLFGIASAAIAIWRFDRPAKENPTAVG